MRIPQEDRASARAPAEIQMDLAAILANGSAVYLKLGPDGAVLSIKLDERTFANGVSIGTQKWIEMSADERAHAVLAWIHRAASYARNPRVRWVPA